MTKFTKLYACLLYAETRGKCDETSQESKSDRK